MFGYGARPEFERKLRLLSVLIAVYILGVLTILVHYLLNKNLEDPYIFLVVGILLSCIPFFSLSLFLCYKRKPEWGGSIFLAHIFIGCGIAMLNASDVNQLLDALPFLVTPMAVAAFTIPFRLVKYLFTVTIVISTIFPLYILDFPHDLLYLAIIYNVMMSCLLFVGTWMVFKDEQELEKERIKILEASKLSSLGIMSSGIAHEINNPLTIISGYMQKLQREVEAGKIDPDQFRKNIEAINRNLTRIQQIVESMQRLATSRYQKTADEVFINTLFEDVKTVCSKKMDEYGIDFQLTDTCPTCSLKINHVDASQILINLVKNACDAIEDLPEKWVKVKCETINGLAHIRVSDSGKGIDRKDQQRIFDPFVTTKDVGKGQGLGLAICKTLAHSWNGDLEYDSSKENTTFVLKLPVSTCS